MAQLKREKKNIRAALIGCGIAAEMHTPAIKSYKGAKIVGVSDLDEGKLTAFGKRHGIDGQFKDFEEMIIQTKPTVVHVLTPPRTHSAITKDVLAHGCAVLVEKPMCMDEAEADSMIKAASTNANPVCMMHNHLFDPVIHKADDLIHSIPGNDPYLVRVTYFVERRKLEEEGDLNPDHWIHRLPLGIYGEHGAPHVLYILLKWLRRASDVNISEMHVNTQKNGRTRLWNVTVSSKGCMGVMTLGDNTTIGQFVVELFTPFMVIRLNLLDLTWTIYREHRIGVTPGRMVASFEESVRRLWSSARNVAAIATGRLKRRPGHRALIKAFYDSIHEGRPSPVPPEEGREVVRVLKWIENKLKNK